MTKSEAQAIYETEVRTAVGHELFEWYLDHIREAYDDDLTAGECVQMIENESEKAYDRQQERLRADDGPSSVAESYAAAHEERRSMRIL